MPVDPSDFLEVARALIKGDPSEAYLRTAVGRAYYAAFLQARDAAGLRNEGSGIHEEVIKHYSNRKDQRIVGNRLSDLRKVRNRADYKPGQSVSVQDVRKAVTQAGRVLSDLQ